MNTPEHWRFGTVGPALPGFELRLAEDGELLIRGTTVFAGYYKEPEATAEVLDADGWLRTGDIAEIDADGFVKITDRKKDIIVTAGGKNIAPQNLENDLKASKYISQALVVGDRRPYPAALVALDAVEIGKWADGRDPRRRADARRRRAGGRAGAGHRRRRQPRTSRFEQIKRFAILPRDFTMERGRGDADAEAEAARDHAALRRRGRRALRHGVDARLADRGERRLDAAGADVAAVVAQVRDLDDVARVRGVDELAAADVDAHVAEPVEEDEVARLEVAVRRPAIP